MSETPPEASPSRIVRILVGIVLGNAAAALQFIGVIIVARQYFVGRPYLAYGTPSLFFVAMTAGFVASIIWRPLRLTMGQSALHSLSSTLLAMGGATIAFHEGIICILMAAPIYYFLFAAGAETLSFPPIVVAGAQSAEGHGHAGDYRIRAGDTLLFD